MHVLLRSAIFGAAVATVAAGCSERLDAGSPVVGPAYDDSDMQYVPTPPVADIETYPAASYRGANVYYVDGRWYRQGARGWAYYRQEPPALASERQERWARERDPRWAPRPATPRPAPPTLGVTEMQPHDHRAEPAPRPPESVPAPPASPENRAPSPPGDRGTKQHVKPAPPHPPPRPPEPDRR